MKRSIVAMAAVAAMASGPADGEGARAEAQRPSRRQRSPLDGTPRHAGRMGYRLKNPGVTTRRKCSKGHRMKRLRERVVFIDEATGQERSIKAKVTACRRCQEWRS